MKAHTKRLSVLLQSVLLQSVLFQSVLLQSVCLLCLSSSLSFAIPFKVDSQLSHTKIHTNAKASAYVKIALTGLELNGSRPPLNLSLVIDRSGSMRGARIQQAQQAAMLAIDMLKPNDILSIIAYDTEAELLLPATKIEDGKYAKQRISHLRANGSTALFAGTKLGGEEVVKFLSRERVNRVVLLSDGIANVGPSSTEDLTKLGSKLASRGIAVSTIGLGLGYNEDLMARLADSSDGNHSFVEQANQLAEIMSLELNDALAVVAQDVELKLTFPQGVRPVRALGREAHFEGQIVTSSIKQLITGTERYVLIEVEVKPHLIKDRLALTDIEISYRNHEGKPARTSDRIMAYGAATKTEMTKSAVASVMESVVELTAREQQELAIKLKDEGKESEASQLMDQSNAYLRSNAIRFESAKLDSIEKKAQADTAVIKKKGKGRDWSRTRKKMRKRAYGSKAQMAF